VKFANRFFREITSFTKTISFSKFLIQARNKTSFQCQSNRKAF